MTSLVYHVVNIYIENHEAIFSGTFNGSLLDHDEQSKYYKAVKILENISAKYIYQNKDVQALELKGYAIVNGLLDIYKPLLELSSRDFSRLVQDERIECFVAMRLIKRISSKQIVAYKNDVKSLDTEDQEYFEVMEWYYRVRLVTDYISGMTDDFALYEYQTLSAVSH